ncbi:MAG: hypothetical protein LC746_09630 [Acidobacteria bacterium]|nr:hypothetical protein [Acidobacteriota bacterium]
MNPPGSQPAINSARGRRFSSVARVASLACASLFVVALVASAQSGRRVQKREDVPPVPTPTPTPEVKKKQEALKRIPVVVMADNSLSADVSSTAQGIVMQSIGQRLRESDAFDIHGDSSSRSTRGDAQKRAKGESDSFVVWFALRYSGAMNPTMGVGRPNPEDYHIEYAVYEPTTGKTRAAGNVYLRPGYGSVGGIAVGVPSCYPATFAYEYEFVIGAIDAANRVIKAFDLPLTPVCGG